MVLRSIYLFVMMLVVFTAPRGYSFALLGPSPATGQTNPAIDWQNSANLDFNIAGIEIGGIVNIGEEYRWVTPEVTYAFDESFLNFFGQEGVPALRFNQHDASALTKATADASDECG